MSNALIKLLHEDELRVLRSYIDGRYDPELEDVFNALDVPVDATPDRIEIAVAQILLNQIQGFLPQWALASPDKVILARHPHRRHKDAKLAFHPKLVCTINWADSGPGYSWPESYHITYMPGFDKFIVTASRDSPDTWDCTDHAIGVVDGG
jgi:hypothetical protein